MKIIGKKKLVSDVAKKAGQNRLLVRDIVGVLLEQIAQELIKGNRILLKDFAVFGTKLHAAKKGRNPYAGEEIDIPAANYIYMKVSKRLKAEVRDATPGYVKPVKKKTDSTGPKKTMLFRAKRL